MKRLNLLIPRLSRHDYDNSTYKSFTYRYINSTFHFSGPQQTNFGLGRIIVEVTRSHTLMHTHTPGRTSLDD